MKIIITSILMTIVALLSSTHVSAYDFEVDGIYYEVTSFTDLTCKVVRGDNKYEGDVTIPSEVSYNSRTLKVTEIEDKAFYECSSLTSVVIPNSVTEIVGSAFSGCSSLASFVIPDSVTEIGSSAFQGCSSLTSVVIPDSVTEIGLKAFSGCTSLTSITIPDSVTKIGSCAFSGCSSLTSISLSNNLKSIKYGTFEKCKALKSISIPGSVLEIEQYYQFRELSLFLFNECESLKEIYFFYGNDVLKSGRAYVTDSSGAHFYSTSWDISWTKRLEKVFIDRQFREYITLQNLKELTIGEHLTELQISQISNCKDLETIVSYAITPPSSDEFSNKQYMDVIVKVPIEALEAYKADPVWKNFWNLEGFDAGDSAVDSIASDDTVNEIGRYDINGKAVNTDYKGIVIIRYSDGTSRKMLNK